MKRTPLKRKTRLRRVSKKKRAQDAIYGPDREQFLKEHPRCEFIRFADGMPAPRLYRAVKPFAMQCLRRSTQVHHIRHRGKWYLDKRYWFASCLWDHAWINDNGKEAERLGYLERVYEKH